MPEIATSARAIRTASAPSPYRGARYSQGIHAGPFVFVSGMIGLDPGNGVLKGTTLAAQLGQVFANIGAVLEAGGTSIRRAVKVTVYLADLADYEEMNELYKRYVVGDPPPARTTVQASLPANALVEVEVTALV
jgi:2-iminobutanoate/2-iminopropanoate deaminase